jgi:hypothetical protein
MVDNLYLSALRTQSLPFRVQEFIDYKIVEIAEKTIVKEIRNQASMRNMPQRYIDGIQAEYDGSELWIWVDFKGKNGEPLDLWFEEGTKRHYIKPVVKKALSWIAAGPIGIFSGFRYFSKGHWVSGMEARHIFRDGLKKGYPDFKKSLQKEIEEYLQETALFGR